MFLPMSPCFATSTPSRLKKDPASHTFRRGQHGQHVMRSRILFFERPSGVTTHKNGQHKLGWHQARRAKTHINMTTAGYGIATEEQIGDKRQSDCEQCRAFTSLCDMLGLGPPRKLTMPSCRSTHRYNGLSNHLSIGCGGNSGSASSAKTGEGVSVRRTPSALFKILKTSMAWHICLAWALAK